MLTNGQTWWLYLPLQPGSWEERRFLTIDLASQEPATVEQRFMEHLSQENDAPMDVKLRDRALWRSSARPRRLRERHSA